MSSSILVKEPYRLPAVGECIYCGGRDQLSDEHIVPFALGGSLILPDASCRLCATITAAIEGRVLRGFMYRARIAGRFPTRRPKERPRTLEVELLGSMGEPSIKLASAEAPVLLQLPTLATAAFLTGEQPAPGVRLVGLETLLFGGRPEAVAKQAGATGLRQVDNLDATSFVRMLAKIGYAYFVAARGLVERKSVPVLPLILGRTDDGSHWIGSALFQTQSEAQGAMHSLLLTDGTIPIAGGTEKVTLARVKLFASLGTTGYEVVVYRTIQRKAVAHPF